MDGRLGDIVTAPQEDITVSYHHDIFQNDDIATTTLSFRLPFCQSSARE
jgi:hypothetical protein